MNGELREVLIEAYLRALDAAHPRAMSSVMLRSAGREAGQLLETRAHESLVADLVEKGWVKEATSEAAPEVRRYQRTEAGRIYLAQLG